MGIPDVKIRIADGGTGATSGSSENVHAKIGVCSLGVPNTVYAFNDKDTMRSTLGVGPLVQDGASPLLASSATSRRLAACRSPLPAGCPRPTNLHAAGFDANEGLLPYGPRSFLRYRLLQEYFSFPEKFLFFDLAGYYNDYDNLRSLEPLPGGRLTIENKLAGQSYGGSGLLSISESGMP